MGSCEVLFMKIQPDLISHMNFVCYLMLIMALPVLGIGFIKNIMKFLLNVLDALNKFVFLINCGLSTG
jgi:hypothetical protein